MFVSLLALSMFTFIVPKASAATYDLTFEAAVEDTITAYEQSVKLAPDAQQLEDITVGVYISADAVAGGTKKDTKAHYTLNEDTLYNAKVPVSAYKKDAYKYSPTMVLTNTTLVNLANPVDSEWQEKFPQAGHVWRVTSGALVVSTQIEMLQLAPLPQMTRGFHVEHVEVDDANDRIILKVRMKNDYVVIFQHWEVWDNTTQTELEWPDGNIYKKIYTGSWMQQGVQYTRITKIISKPKDFTADPARPALLGNLEYLYGRSDKELLDRSDGVLEPYLSFKMRNPAGGGNKKIIAVYYIGWGPETEHAYWKTIKGADATRTAFTKTPPEIDVTFDLIRTIDIDAMGVMGKITSTPGFHMCYIGFNLRLAWAGPQDGGQPGFGLRKAVAHLIPKDTLIATLFKYIVVRLDSWLPPSLGEWFEPGVTVYDYNPKAAYDSLVAGGWTYDAGLGTWKNGTKVAGGADSTITFMSPLYEVAPTSYTIAARVTEELNGLKNPYTGAATPLKASHAPTDFWTIVEKAFALHDFEMYFLCWGLSSIPGILYAAYHSANDIAWGDNAWGLHNDELDDLLEIVEFGLNHLAKVQAAKDAQIKLSTLLPNIPIYSRNYFNAHQKDFYGAVLTPGDGIDTGWSYMNMKGRRTSPLFAPPLTQIAGNQTIWHNGEFVESYNPAQLGSVYAARVVFGNLYDGLIAGNPYTLEDKPWLAKSWTTVGPVNMTTPNGKKMVNGQYVEFTLDDRVVEGKVLWHDGEVFNAEDIIASWTYASNLTGGHALTNFFGFWEDLIDVHSPSKDKVRAYWNVTSQWLQYDAAGVAAIFAPQIWRDYVSKPVAQGGLGLVTDAQIRTFAPHNVKRSKIGPYPAAKVYPWLTAVVGTGFYIFYSGDTVGTSNLFAYDHRSYYGGQNTLKNVTLVNLASPISTQWTERLPTIVVPGYDRSWEYDIEWHLESWEDGQNPGAPPGTPRWLNASDQIDLQMKLVDIGGGKRVGPKFWFHVDEVTYDPGTQRYTLKLTLKAKEASAFHYWKSKSEIKEQKIEDFYHIGDVTIDMVVDISDLSAVGRAYGKKQVPYVPPPGPSYKGFRREDVVHDGIVNILDLATAGKNFGKEGES